MARDRHIPLIDGDALAVDAVVLATGYRPGLDDFLPRWREVCDDAGVPLVSGRPSAIAGLDFCGQLISPNRLAAREIALEARRIARAIAHA